MEQRYCAQCGTRAASAATRFCVECGHQLRTATEAAPPVTIHDSDTLRPQGRDDTVRPSAPVRLEKPPSAPPPPPPPAPTRPKVAARSSQRPVVVGVLITAVVVLLVATVALTFGLTRRSSDTSPASGGGGGGRIPVEQAADTSSLDLSQPPTDEWTFDPASVVPDGSMSPLHPDEHGFAPPEVLGFDDHVVAAVNLGSSDGELVGLDGATGDLAWSHPVDGVLDCMDEDTAATLICAQIPTSGAKTTITSIDPSTGETLASSRVYFSGPQLSIGPSWEILVLGYTESGIEAAALNLDDLTELWRTSLDHGPFEWEDDGRIREYDGDIVVDKAGAYWRLDSDDGSILEERPDIGGYFDDGFVVDPDWGGYDGSETRVSDLDGFTVLTAAGTPWVDQLRGYVDQGTIGIGSSLYDLTDGAARWDDPQISVNTPYFTLDRDEVLYTDSRGTAHVLDAESGGQRAQARSEASGHPWWFGDLDAGVVEDDGTLHMLDLQTGHESWGYDVSDITAGGDFGQLADVGASSAGLVVVGQGGVRGLVGFPSDDSSTDEPGDGGTDYVTDCGSEPVFTPIEATAADGGVSVEFTVTATCPGGQWLAYSDQQISVEVDGDTYASGSFDFASEPRWVSEDGTTMDLVYPPGSAFSTPDEINEAIQRDGGTGDVVHVPCEKGPDAAPGSVPADPDEASDDPVSAGGSAESDDEDSESALEALRRIAAEDSPYLDSDVAGSWVPQLSSKKPGTADDGIVYDYDDILAEHLRLRLRYPDVRLAFSTDWGTYQEPGYWVTLVARTSPGSAPALGFCTSESFDRDHCYAKLLRRTGPPDGATVLLPEG